MGSNNDIMWGNNGGVIKGRCNNGGLIILGV